VNGAAYVAGYTDSPNFPTMTGAFSTTLRGGQDVFVTKLNPAGSALAYSTLIGGTGDDQAYDIALSNVNIVYLAGITYSSDFPTTVGAFQPSATDAWNAFVAKLNLAGAGASDLVYSSYLGGGSYDDGYSIAIGPGGTVYVAGRTASSDFPTTTGAFSTTLRGMEAAFVTKLNPIGSGSNDLVYSTILGGAVQEQEHDLAVDGNGNAYVVGWALSPDFPTTPGALQISCASCPSSGDAFLSELSPLGNGKNDLLYSTFLGGSDYDDARGIALHGNSGVYVTGITDSPDFTTTNGAYQTTHNGGTSDSFLVNISMLKSGSKDLVYSTFLGGNGSDYGLAIASDGDGTAYATGDTHSSNFPTTAGVVLTATAGGADAYVIKINLGVYSVSGRVVDGANYPIPGATLFAGSAYSTTTNSSGYYTLTGVLSGTYVLTPSLSNYTFSPITRSITVPPNATGQNFTGTLVTYSIAGQVTDGSGNPIAGATVSDGAGHNTTSASNGDYVLSPLLPGTYTVTVTQTGYTFSPASCQVTVPPNATNQNFTGTLITYSIAGQITDGSSNPIAGATVSDGAGHNTTSASNGNYVLSPLLAGTYTVMASKTGYTFSPASRQVTVPPDATNQNFTAQSDLSFRPNPDGYGFNNPGESSQRPNCEEFKAIFSSEPIVCTNGEPKGTYARFYVETRDAFAPGLCVGMSTTSLDYFVGGLSKPRPVNTYELNQDESWHNIMLYHGRQKSQAYYDALVAEWNNWSNGANTSALVDDVYQRLRAALQSSGSDSVTLLIWPKPGDNTKIGHAVAPYRIDDSDPIHPKVYVYENFAKGDSYKYIQFNLSGTILHSFSYASPFGIWNSANRALVLAPLSLWHSNDATKLYQGPVASKSGGGELVISSSGQMIGYINGVLTATMPGALPAFSWSAPDVVATTDPSYMLPKGHYMATIGGAVVPYTYSIWTTRTLALVYSGVTVTQAQLANNANTIDQIATNDDGDEITLYAGNGASRPYSFNLMRSQPNASKTYEVINTNLGQGASLVTGVGISDALYLRNGTQLTSYDLRLQSATNDNSINFYHRSISISASDVQTITIDSWQQMAAVTLQIDHGGDGTIDETITLDNQINRVYLPLILRNF